MKNGDSVLTDLMSVLAAPPMAYGGPLEMAKVKWFGIHGNTF